LLLFHPGVILPRSRGGANESVGFCFEPPVSCACWNRIWQCEGGTVTTPEIAAGMRIRVHNYTSSAWAAYDDVHQIDVMAVETKYYYAAGQSLYGEKHRAYTRFLR
jgi:hypothetical protein